MQADRGMETITEVTVDFEVLAEQVHRIGYNSPILQDHYIDSRGVDEADRPGQARRLIAGAACGCFCNTVRLALIARHARLERISGRATAISAKDPRRGEVLKSIHITVKVALPEEDMGILARVKKIAEKGCLITKSISPSIEVTHEIVVE
jgi:organic hydroperoxide reductase OsmC/OhrA